MDSFAEHPETVGERRAQKASDCRAWKPRDALIQVLRQIDDGSEDVTDLIVVYRSRSEDRDGFAGYRTSYTIATTDGGGVLAMGMMQRAAYLINQQAG